MKVAFLFFVFLALAFCQNHARIQLDSVDLVNSAADSDDRHSERTDTVIDQEINTNLCNVYFHRVTNVDTNNPIRNSGVYFSVTFDTTSINSTQPITFTFGEPNEEVLYSIVDFDNSPPPSGPNNEIGTCPTGTTCRFDYYCTIFDNPSSLEVVVYSDSTTADETTVYDLTVTQYIDDIVTIPSSRTVNDGNNPDLARPFSTANLGPENFLHFYHDLNVDESESINEGILYIMATFNSTSVGTPGDSNGVICVSYSHLVGTTAAVPGSSNTNLLNGLPDATNSEFATSASPCADVICGNGVITSQDTIYVAIDTCDVCNIDDLWIGVRLGDAAVDFDVTLAFRQQLIPTVTSVPNSPYLNVGRLRVDTTAPDNGLCDYADGDFSCVDFYNVNSGSIADARLGFLSVDIFNPINGDFRASLHTGLGSADDVTNAPCAGCYTLFDSCSDLDNTNYCNLFIAPCSLNSNTDYLVSVQAVDQDDDEFSANYGIRITRDSFPLITIASSFDQTLYNTVKTNRYVHYQITFGASDIHTDSYFYAELYPENPVRDVLSFAWNFNEIAGGSPCYDNLGICSTETDCNYDEDDVLDGNTARTFCRFLFVNCPISAAYDTYFGDFDNYSGIRVGQLQAGTYYFAVWHTSDTVGPELEPNSEIKYTLNFNHLRSIPLYDNAIVPGRAYYLEYSPQYLVTIPNDPSISTITIIADNVNNGVVTFYAKCGALAGECPCWSYDAECTVVPEFASDAELYRFEENKQSLNTDKYDGKLYEAQSFCEMSIARCVCGDSNQLYISAQTITPGDSSLYVEQYNNFYTMWGFDSEKPAYFTLGVEYHITEELNKMPVVQASRAGTTVFDFFRKSQQRFAFVSDNDFLTDIHSISNVDAKYYRVRLDDVVVTSADALFITLNVQSLPNDGDTRFLELNYNEDYDFNPKSVIMSISKDVVPDLDSHTRSRGYFFDNLFFPFGDSFSSPCSYDFCVAQVRARPDIDLSFSGDFNENFLGQQSSCSIFYQPCGRCAEAIRGVDTDEFYIAINNVGDELQEFYAGFFNPNNFNDRYNGLVRERFSINVQVVDQTPKPMRNGLTYYGSVEYHQYRHFSFDVSSTNPNSKLVIEMYRDNKDQLPLELFVNYYDGTGEPVWAGQTQDCYENIACDTCILFGDRQNKCIYNFQPCILAEQSGTYYASVRIYQDFAFIHDDFDNPTEPITAKYNDYSGYTGKYSTYQNRIGEGADFSLSIYTVDMQQIFVNNNPVPVSGNLLPTEGFFYAITTPANSNGVIGRILNVEIENFSTDDIDDDEAIVGFSLDTPDTYCALCGDVFSNTIGIDDTDEQLRLVRAPCQRSQSTYYLAIYDTRQQYFGFDDDDCGAVSYGILAYTDDITEDVIALENENTDDRIRLFYDNTITPETEGFTVSGDEIYVLRFNVNANAGEFLAITVGQANDDVGLTNSPISAYVSVGDYFVPTTTDDFTGIFDDLTCGVAALDTLTVAEGTTDTTIFQPCDIDSDTFYITFYGPDLGSPGAITDRITVLIELYTTAPAVAPVVGTPGVTNTVTYSDLDVDFYSYVTDSFAVSAGQELIFNIDDGSATMWVRKGAETGMGCSATCVAQTCTFYACEGFTDEFYIFVQSTSGNTQTITITLNAAGPATSTIQASLTDANPTLLAEPGLGGTGNVNDYDQDYVFYSYNFAANNDGSFDFSTTATNVYYVENQNVVMPGFTAAGTNEFVLFNDGTTDLTCGWSLFADYDIPCCYDAQSGVIAVRGPQGGDYDIEVVTADYISSSQQINGAVTATIATGEGEQVKLYTFDVSTRTTGSVTSRDSIYFTFEVTAGSAEIVLNQGTRAGSATTGTPGECYSYDDFVGDDVCNGPITTANPCAAFLPSCLYCSDDPSTTYTFAVYGDEGTTFTLDVSTVPTVQLASSSSPPVSFNGVFPPSGVAGENTIFATNDGAAYSQLQYTFPSDPQDVATFVPRFGTDGLTDDEDLRLVFTFTNFADSTGASVDNPFEIYIASSPNVFASAQTLNVNGETCNAGQDITATNTAFPCIETGGPADFNNTHVVCSILLCDLGCEGTVYFSLARASSFTSDSYSYQLTIDPEFSDYVDNDDLQLVNLNVNSATSSVSSPSISSNEPVYFKVSNSIASTNNFGYFTVSVESEDDLDNFTVDIMELAVNYCGTNTITSVCGTTSVDEICESETIYDCGSSAFVFNELSVYIIVERLDTGGDNGLWSATLQWNTVSIASNTVTQTLSLPNSGTYSETFELAENDWQFFSFNVPENDGYSVLEVTVSSPECAVAAATLDVYASWGDNGGSYGEIIRLNGAYPGDETWCHRNSGDTTPFMSFSQDTCQFVAGEYRLSIYNEFDNQLFDDTDSPFISYTVTATLTSIPHIVMDDCSITVDVATDARRIEIPIGATNPGAELIFTVESASPATVFFSRNGYPFGTTTACDFGAIVANDDDDGFYVCDAATCSLAVSRCKFTDDVWYAYIASATETVTISYDVHAVYVAQMEANVVYSGVASSAVIPAEITYIYDTSVLLNFYNFYRFDATSAFLVYSYSTPCSNCPITTSITSTFKGFGPVGGLQTDSGFDYLPDIGYCSDSTCEFDDACTFGINSDDHCKLYNGETLCIDVTTFFISVGANEDNDSSDCNYTINIVQPTIADAVTLTPGEECNPHGEVDLYTFTIPANNYAVVDATDDDVDFFYSYGDLSCFVALADPLTIDGCVAESSTVYIWAISDDDEDCDDHSYVITLEYFTSAIGTVSTSVGSGSDILSFTTGSQFTVANQDVNVFTAASSSVAFDATCGTTCVRQLDPNTQYFIDGNPSGLAFTTINPVSLSATSTVSVQLDSDTPLRYYSIVVPSGTTASSISFSFDNLDFTGSFTGNPHTVDDIDFVLYRIDSNPSPFTCAGCDMTAMTSGSCDYSFATITEPTCGYDVLYLTLGNCDASAFDVVCGISFDLHVTLNGDFNLPTVPSGTHQSAWQTLSFGNSADCDYVAPPTTFVTTVTNNILSVSLRNLVSSDAVATVSISSVCSPFASCAIDHDDTDVVGTCTTQTSDCDFSVPNGEYVVSFSTVSFGTYEYQVVNQFVDLASSISSQIYGETNHFYRLTNVNTAITLTMSIQNGASLEFIVSDRLDTSSDEAYTENRYCHKGACSIYIPTFAERPSSGQLFVFVKAGQNDGQILGDITNVNYDKSTSYSLSVTRGTANCASPPSSGFCADTSIAGVNVWASVSNSVWNFNNPTLKNNEAQCLYTELLDRCVAPSEQCKEFLKVFACVNTFPQCDANGYQMGVCNDLCLQVEEYCGGFRENYSGLISSNFEFDEHYNYNTLADHTYLAAFSCNSGRYVSGSGGSCYNDLPIVVPPTPVNPLSFFQDDDDVSTFDLPGEIIPPVFSPIYATIPPIVNDDDDGIGLKNQVVETFESSSSVMQFSLVLAFFLISLLI